MVAIVSDNELDTISGPVAVRSGNADLAKMVALMGSNVHVVGVIAAGELKPGPDLFERAIARTAQVQTRSIRDHDEKLRCMTSVAELLDTVKSSRDRKETILQCVDELVMNALYDAPVDGCGRHLFTDIAVKDRIRMRTDRAVTVRFGYDGTTFAIAVRDQFGSLARDTVLRFLDKALHSAAAVDRRASGGGVGLYLVASAATVLAFAVTPATSTEIVCGFGLDRAARLGHLSFLAQPAGALSTAPNARRIVVARRYPWLFRGTVGLVVGLVVGIALVIGHRFFGAGRPVELAITTESGASVELDGRVLGTAVNGTFELTGLRANSSHRLVVQRDGFETARAIVQGRPGSHQLGVALRPLATVDIETDPADATVTIAGMRLGATPLAVTSLAPGASVSVSFTRQGYQPATVQLTVPAAGQRSRLTQNLERSGDAVLVRLSSTPPGAAIVRAGELLTSDRTFTPAELYLPAGQAPPFTFVMPGYKPFTLEPFAVGGSQVLEKSAVLVAQ